MEKKNKNNNKRSYIYILFKNKKKKLPIFKRMYIYFNVHKLKKMTLLKMYLHAKHFWNVAGVYVNK